jgi:hypothetical protein
MTNGEVKIDHEAIRTGSIPWSADELNHVLHQARGMDDAVHIASARARDLGLDTGTAIAHGMRLFAILDFLDDHRDRLYECGLLLPSDTEFDEISYQLLEVLATFPLTTPTGERGVNGRDHLGFDADDVIIEAGRRQQILDDSNPN